MKDISILLFSLLTAGLSYAQLTATNLPIIKIYTGSTAVTDTQVLASMVLINNASGTNTPGDAPQFSGNIGIELKGSSSDPKRNYYVETWTTFKEETDVALMDMGAENDWWLTAMYSDRSLMRYLLANKIFGDMGNWVPKQHLCELMINDEYKGVYLFGETIKRDTFRLDIANLKNTDSWYPEITGGYILKIDDNNNDGFVSSYPPPFANGSQNITFHFEVPEDDEITLVQQAWIKSYTDSFENELNAAGFQDTVSGWRAHASQKSVADYLILNEVLGNEQAYRKNTYIWKDKEKKFRFGPLWNANDILANTAKCNANAVNGWMYLHGQVCGDDTYLPAFWWQKFMTDTALVSDLKCRYTDLRRSGGTLDTVTLFAYIDATAGRLNAAGAGDRNFGLYPIFGVSINNEPLPVSATYDEEIGKVKQYLRDRLAFLDTQWITTGCSTVSIHDIQAGKVFTILPNPAHDQVIIRLSTGVNTACHLTVFNTLGQRVYESNGFEKGINGSDYTLDCSHWPAGTYHVELKDAKGTRATANLVKQ